MRWIYHTHRWKGSTAVQQQEKGRNWIVRIGVGDIFNEDQQKNTRFAAWLQRYVTGKRKRDDPVVFYRVGAWRNRNWQTKKQNPIHSGGKPERTVIQGRGVNESSCQRSLQNAARERRRPCFERNTPAARARCHQRADLKERQRINPYPACNWCAASRRFSSAQPDCVQCNLVAGKEISF